MFLVINLKQRTDRRERVYERCKAAGIEAQFIEAVEADTLHPQTEQKGRFLTTLTPAEQACSLSHVKALDHFLASGESWAVIAEDDIVPQEVHIPQKLEALAQKLNGRPIKIEMLGLDSLVGHHKIDALPECGLELVIYDRFGMGSAAYMVDQAAAIYLRHTFASLMKLTDVTIESGLADGVETVTCRPLLFVQEQKLFEYESDIRPSPTQTEAKNAGNTGAKSRYGKVNQALFHRPLPYSYVWSVYGRAAAARLLINAVQKRISNRIRQVFSGAEAKAAAAPITQPMNPAEKN